MEVVHKKRDDVGFLCFIALVVKELGFQEEYEVIVEKFGLKKMFGE